MKVLQIIETGYRATLEEQDDPILWLTRCFASAGSGSALTVVLAENAVNYALLGQDASGLTLGRWTQRRPPQLAGDIAALLASGVGVFALAEDLERRGLLAAQRVPGVEVLARGDLPGLIEAHDRVWHW
jgi:hypothetical protein